MRVPDCYYNKVGIMVRLISIRAALISFMALVLSACFPTVDYVDIERYMGTWYQISANETFFNENLVGVTATYTLQDDGTVEVLNRGFENTLDGPLNEIYGTATVVDKQTNAKLSVSFPTVPINFPFANYLIVVLDQTDYQYAAVTDPAGTTLFILSRTPSMSPTTYAVIIDELEAIGVRTDRLVITPQ